MTVNPKCYSVDDTVAHLLPAYNRLALVSHQRHIDQLETEDANTLVVSSNWLIWQECLAKGIHCVHSNRGLLNWDAEKLAEDLFILSNDWTYIDNEDATLFRGVSLGRKFLKDLSLAIADYERLHQSLSSLCAQFGVQEILYFGLRTDYGYLDEDARRFIVRQVAHESNVLLSDHSAPVDAKDQEFPTNQETGTTTSFRTTVSDWGRAAFEAFFGTLSKLRCRLEQKRGRVLALTSQLTGVPLIREISADDWFLLTLAQWFPHKRDLKFLTRSFLKGALPIHATRTGLNAEDQRTLGNIRQRFTDSWTPTSRGRQAFIQDFVQRHILQTDRLERKAVDVRWATSVLDAYQPDQILTDGLQNSVNLTFIELAKARNVPVTATLHAHWIQDARLEIFGCDPRIGPLADRCFSWGRANEAWLKSIGAQTTAVRTGNPIAGKYLGRPRPKQANRGRVLVLQYTLDYGDLSAQSAQEYEFFVRAVRMLTDLNYPEIRLRLHPGVPKASYYQRIADFFGMVCDINDSGSFEDQIAWADFVIGPAISGAMLEVLASGKDYYPVLLPPTAVNPSYLDGGTYFTDFKSLQEALQTKTKIDQEQLLDDFTSVSEYRNPAARMWEALKSHEGIDVENRVQR